jgi:D-glycero-D-manno-heptose 1,7-bisphosphate phosphatase
MRPYDLWIFDADDTLRRCTVPGQPCPHRDGEWELVPGVAARLRRISWNGPGGPWLGIASNQDRVGYGRFTAMVARELLRAAARAATGIDLPDGALRFCPHRPEEQCRCRKPRPGMLLDVMAFYGISPASTVFVGDSETDRLAARAAGVDFVWAADFFSSSDAPFGRRTRQTRPHRGADSYDAGASRWPPE